MIKEPVIVNQIFKATLGIFEELTLSGRISLNEENNITNALAKRIEEFDTNLKILSEHNLLKAYLNNSKYLKYLSKNVVFDSEQKSKLSEYCDRNGNDDLWIHKVLYDERSYNELLLANLASLKKYGINLNYKFGYYGESMIKAETTLLMYLCKNQSSLTVTLLLPKLIELEMDINMEFKIGAPYFGDGVSREMSLLDYMCSYASYSKKKNLSNLNLISIFEQMKIKKDKSDLEAELEMATGNVSSSYKI